jgi:hypothetical protein
VTVSLPSFTIDTSTHIYDILGSSDGSNITTEALEKTRVVFTSNIEKNGFIVYEGDLYRPVTKVYADVGVDGTISQNGFAVELLANDDGLSVSNIQWTVTILVPTPGGIQVMTPWTFTAPASGTVEDLSETVPVAYVDAVGVTRGPKGDPVDDVALIDGALVFYVDGETIGSPIDLGVIDTIVNWSDILEVPATFPPTIGSGAAQAVAGNDSRLTDTRTPSDGSVSAGKLDSALASEISGKLDASTVGTVGGPVPLDGTLHVPSAYLPGFIDAIVDYDTLADFPGTGETGQMYIADDTEKTYRWNDGSSTYVEISPSPGSTDSVAEGSVNLYYTAARVNTLIAATLGVSVQAYNASLAAIAALTPGANDVVQYVSGAWVNRTVAQLKTSLTLTASDVGLGSANNTADAAKAVLSATKLATARNINGVLFDGTADISISGSSASSINLEGTYGSMPAAGTQGRVYFCTDTGDVYWDTGSAWTLIQIGRGPILGRPPTASWSTYGTPAGASVSASSGGQLMQWANTGSSDSLFIQARPLSLTSGYASGWTATYCIDWNIPNATYAAGFVCIGDGTKWVMFGPHVYTSGAIRLDFIHIPTVTGSPVSVKNDNSVWAAQVMTCRWYRLSYDGTNLNASWSNNGIDWNAFYSESYTAYCTPTYVGWGCDTVGSSAYTAYGRLRSLTGVS